MADSTFNASVKITASFEGQGAVQEARRALGGVEKQAISLGGALKTLAGAYAFRQVVMFTKSVIDLGDSLNNLRESTGISAQFLSDMKAAAEDGGVGFDQLQVALKKFSVNLSDAAAGSVKAKAGFEAIGISIRNASGEMKPSKELLLEIADKFKNLKDGPDKAAVAVALFGKAGADLIPVLNEGRKGIEGMGTTMSEEFIKQSKKFNDELNRTQRNLTGIAASILEIVLPAVNALGKTFNMILENADFGEFGSGFVAPKKQGPRLMLRSSQNGFNDKPTVVDKSKLADNAEKYRSQNEAIKKYRIEGEKEVALEKQKIEQLGISSAAYEKNIIAIKMRADADKATVGFFPEKKKIYLEETEALIRLRQANIDLAEAQKRTFGAGAKKAFADYVDAASNTAKQFENLFSGALKNIEDALVKFVQTGKLSFSDLVGFIEEALIRIAVQKTIAGAISGISELGSFSGWSASASAGGNVIGPGGPIPLRKYANGGIANSPHVALFGEGSRPEAFVPLPDGRSIPVTMDGGGGTNVVVNVNMAGGSESSESSANASKGKAFGRMIANVVKATIVQEQRPGGSLA